MPEQTLEKNFEALESMTDMRGIIQHESDPKYDYSIDDQARALIVLSKFSNNFLKENLVSTYLNYLNEAKRFDGWFNNYKNADGNWKGRDGKTEDPDTLQDCYGRTMWGLSEFLSSKYNTKSKKQAENLFFNSIETADKLIYPHSLAFTIIALSKLPKDKQTIKIKRTISKLSKKLIETSKIKNWMTYCVARIPQAMLLAGETLSNKRFKESGKKFLDKVINKCFDEDAVFHPIKNPWGAEQPAEGLIIEACVDAYNITKKEIYKQCAINAMQWFSGQNSKGLDLLAKNGAVYDAITSEGKLNTNQGAESIVTYIMARSAIMDLKD